MLIKPDLLRSKHPESEISNPANVMQRQCPLPSLILYFAVSAAGYALLFYFLPLKKYGNHEYGAYGNEYANRFLKSRNPEKG